MSTQSPPTQQAEQAEQAESAESAGQAESTLGATLSRLQHEAGLAARELATALGVSVVNLEQWLSSEATLTESDVAQLSAQLRRRGKQPGG